MVSRGMAYYSHQHNGSANLYFDEVWTTQLQDEDVGGYEDCSVILHDCQAMIGE